MDSKVKAIDQAKLFLNENKSFVLQGGAGSGKTEALKELLHYLSLNHPEKKLVCITHTNLAVDEIKSRVGDQYLISTIHSFLHGVIKDYKRNIKSVISELYTIPQMIRSEMTASETEASYKTAEHGEYKKIYNKYAERLYSIKKENCEKAVGKREYDKDPVTYNDILNKNIEMLNKTIVEIIEQVDAATIKYNDTKFNSFRDMTYGHDGLLDIAILLFNKYPVLKKIICDKYDYIFIDEYQDTNDEIIKIFLSIAHNKSFTVCLFGDTMQAIYPDGIGCVNEFITSGDLHYIPKADNYRCSQQVLDLINTLRLDDIKQEIALKIDNKGHLETIADRQGIFKLFYAVCDKKPTSRDNQSEKDVYLDKLDKLISYAQSQISGEIKILLLTNKAIAKKSGFSNLYQVFDERYIEVGDRMDEIQKIIQITDLCELLYCYTEKQYNQIINKIKRNGFILRKISDKQYLNECINLFFTNNYSFTEALEVAFELKLLKKSDSHINYISRKDLFLNEINSDKAYQEFKTHYLNGYNTYARISDLITNISEEEFKELNESFKREQFYRQLFSNNIKFKEAINYFYYANEKTNYITMHKTKGSSINSIIVVMDEYFWNNEYDFSLIYFNPENKTVKKERSQKLIYVACSRAKTNLVCIRMITPTEEQAFLKNFSMAQKVDI